MARTPNQPTTTTTSTTEPSSPANQEARETGWRALLRQFRPAIMLTLMLTLILGIVYPLVTTGVAQVIFPSQANGSMVCVNGKPIGSSLIGQYWTQPQYFPGPALGDQQSAAAPPLPTRPTTRPARIWGRPTAPSSRRCSSESTSSRRRILMCRLVPRFPLIW